MLLSHTGGINCNRGFAGFSPDQPSVSTVELLQGKNSAFGILPSDPLGEPIRAMNELDKFKILEIDEELTLMRE